MEHTHSLRLRMWSRFALAFFLGCFLYAPTHADAYTQTLTQNHTSVGQTLNFNFTNLPPSSTNISVRVTVFGDYEAIDETASLSVTGSILPVLLQHTGGTPNCSANGHTQTFTIPASSISAAGALSIRATPSRAVSPTECTNLTERITINITYTERATDLTIPSLLGTPAVTTSSATTAAGSSVRFNYSIRNTGVAFTDDFVVNYYYCRQRNTTTCTAIGNQTITTNFTANQTVQFSRTLTLPNTVVRGTGYIRAFVNATGTVKESNTTNNNNWGAFTVNGRPDLRVTALTISPTTDVGPGTTMTVNYAIRNAGNTRAQGTFYLRLYYSTNGTTLTNGLRTVTFNSLDAQTSSPASGTTTTTVTLPSSMTAGSTRYIIAFVDYNNRISEGTANEGNNRRSASFTVSTKPDIQITALNLATSGTVGAGLSEPATFTLINRGQAFSNTITAQFYYCRQNNNTNCVAVGGAFSITGGFNANQSRNFNRTITLPNSVVRGTGYLRLDVDVSNVVAESNENNNTRYDAFTVNARPNLTVSVLNVIETQQAPGANVRVTYQIANTGRVRVENIILRIGYSTTNNGTLSGTYKQDITFSLDALSNSNTATVTVQVSPSATPGSTRYMVGHVDYNNRVYEGSTTNENDNKRSDSFQIIQSDPNLDITNVTVLTTGTVGAGSSIGVRYTIRNRLASFTTNFSVRIYYCSTRTTTSCFALGSAFSVTENFSVNETRTETRTVTLPNSVVYGARYIRVFVDSATNIKETDETDNNNFGTLNITARPDLRVNFISATPTSGEAGDSIPINYRTHNAGLSAAPSASLRFYYSADATITTTDTNLNQDRSILHLANVYLPSQTTTSTVTITLPSTVQAGTRYLGAYIDWNGKINEGTNENNNTRSTPITITAAKPDLEATVATPTPTSQLPGQKVSVAYAVKNNTSTSIPSYRVHIYYSTDATITTADTLLLNFSRSTLAGNTTHTGTRTVTLPGTLAAGAGFIGILVDPTDTFKESNENNNAKASAFTVLADDDKDGVPANVDCDDKDKDRFPAYNGNAANPEVCDGKDNNCDNMVDNGITCTEPTTEKPVTEQPTTEKPVTENPTTENPTTDAGTPEQPIGDRPPGDCYTNGCPTGEICVSGACVADPCANKTCQADEVCKAGTCEKVCGCLKCASGEHCVDGACETDKCASANCANGEVCNPIDGKCIKNPCLTVRCSTGRICEKTTGNCIDDPCNHLSCPQGTQCQAGQCLGTQCSEGGEPAGEGTNTEQTPGEGTNTEQTSGEGTNTEPTTGEQTTENTSEVTTDGGTEPTTGEQTTENTTTEPQADGGTEVSTENTVDGGGSESSEPKKEDGTTITDKTIGGDGAPSDNGQAPSGGCGCSTNEPVQTPLTLLLFLLVFGLIHRKKTQK